MSVGVEKDEVNFGCIQARLQEARDADSLLQYRDSYIHTPSLNEIWPLSRSANAHCAVGCSSDRYANLIRIPLLRSAYGTPRLLRSRQQA